MFRGLSVAFVGLSPMPPLSSPLACSPLINEHCSNGIFAVSHQGATICDAASAHFGPTIRRTGILARYALQLPGVYPRFKKWGTNHDKCEERGAEGLRCGEGVSFSPPKERSGEGYPLPRNLFSIFELKMASSSAFWELILFQLNCLPYTHKPVNLDFGW